MYIWSTVASPLAYLKSPKHYICTSRNTDLLVNRLTVICTQKLVIVIWSRPSLLLLLLLYGLVEAFHPVVYMHVWWSLVAGMKPGMKPAPLQLPAALPPKCIQLPGFVLACACIIILCAGLGPLPSGFGGCVLYSLTLYSPSPDYRCKDTCVAYYCKYSTVLAE